MSLNAASRTAQVPLYLAPSRFVSAAMEILTSLFRVTAPAISSTRLLHLVLLAAILGLGTFVRFWGLGSVGLHGDEETMAMAVAGILREGVPILPSGMFYPRGMTQLYLMALSVSVFGESEWALRLPSAICGVALIAICFLVGRRFLRPEWNLAFVASVALLPELVIYSQTARMYIFLVTCVAATMVLVFAWERTNRIRWLVAAASTLILGMDMQVLSVAGIFIFLMPGLVHSDARRLLQGILASVVAFIGFVVINTLVEAQYPVPPPEFAASLPTPAPAGSDVPLDFPLIANVFFWSAFAVLTFCCWRIAKSQGAKLGLSAALLLVMGALLQIALFYHMAALCYLVGGALAIRNGSSSTARWLGLFLLGAATLAVVHALLLASEARTVIRLVGAMVGQPSVWPYVRVAQLSVAAGLVCGVLLLWGVYQLARGRTVPDYWLLLILLVWAPVFALGVFAWNVPPRYTAVALIPMLVCAFAALQGVTEKITRSAARAPHAIAAGVAALCIINPVQALSTVNAGYRIHPDHKGTAEFLQSQGIREEDIILAEDVLQQTYYLGKVDYWLIGPAVARRFVMSRNDEVVDFYTGTPVVVSEAMLDLILLKNADKRIFVVVSGEEQYNGRSHARGPELQAALKSQRFETVYVGRDGVSKVLRAVPDVASDVVSGRDIERRAHDEGPAQHGTQRSEAPTVVE